ncbi:MAG: hypothetical protein WBG35_13820 [Acidobacteriaceae bacterium]
MRRSASLHPILRNERDGWGARIVVVRCCKPPKLILATLPGCDQDLAIAVVQLAYFHGILFSRVETGIAMHGRWIENGRQAK